MRALFLKVAQYWTPKQRSKSKKSLENLETEDLPSEPQGTQGKEEPDEVAVESPANEGVIDGVSTPISQPKASDEYLAWTLGGDLVQNSPGFIPDTPAEKRELDEDLATLLAQLETLGLKTIDMICNAWCLFYNLLDLIITVKPSGPECQNGRCNWRPRKSRLLGDVTWQKKHSYAISSCT